MLKSNVAALGVGLLLAMASSSRAADAAFEFTLDRPAITSAGVYDSDGRLTRVLWTRQALEAGKTARSWDGKDDLGKPAASGEYELRVAVDRADYVNVGAIGNSGKPPDAAGHTPTHMGNVAADDVGAVYTANGWDEAGADFKKWDSSGKSVYDAHYQIRNGHPNGAPYAIALDEKYLYCSVGGWAKKPWNEAQQIQRFRRSDGKEEKFTATGRPDGHIQVYEWPRKQVPPDAAPEVAERIKAPLRGIAASGDSLFVADYLGNRVLQYDKSTGTQRGEYPAHRPTAIAINPVNHQLWIASDGLKIQTLGTIDKPAQPTDALALPGAQSIEEIAFGSDGRFYVADSGRDQVFIADSSGHVTTFGARARPGDRAADRFFHLNGVAPSTNGDLYTTQDEPFGGSRLARWTPAGDGYKLAWEQFGCEFVSLGNYGADDPDAFFSMTFHRYRLGDHNAGAWDYTGCVAPFMTRRYYSDVHGAPRVIKLGEHRFYFLPSGDGVQVYRIDPDQMRLSAMIGGRSPTPDGEREGKTLGEWTWHDAAGDGVPAPQQIDWHKKPGEAHYACFGMDVDPAGDVVFADLNTHSIRLAPVGPLDSHGNPTYDWATVREIVPRDSSPLKFQPNMAQRAADGSVYAFGWSAQWPQPKNNPFWMGGTTLVRFDPTGKRIWAVGLPKLCVGLDVIPGGAGGCVVGIGDGAHLLHYTADGLLVAEMAPGEAMRKQSGWLDNHASVAVNRDPRDARVDVFAEDDYTLRIGWYRFDDAKVQTIRSPIRLP